MVDDLPVFLLLRKDSNKRSKPKFSSGTKISSAPEPTPAFRAMCPTSLPITSTKNNRLWELAVSLILSIASTAVLSAVSYPRVKFVPKISLSIVPGIPIIGKLYSLLKIMPPVKVPSPPISTKASMFFLTKWSYANFLPSFVLNSCDLAVFKNVPPLFMMLLTLRAFKSLKSPSIIP